MRQRRELGDTIVSTDLNISASMGAHEESSAHGYMDILNQKLGLHTAQPSTVDKWHPLSSISHEKSWQVSEAGSIIHPFEIPPDQ